VLSPDEVITTPAAAVIGMSGFNPCLTGLYLDG